MRDARYFLTPNAFSQALDFPPSTGLLRFGISLSLSVSLLAQPLAALSATPAKPQPKPAASSGQSAEALIDKAQLYAQQERFGDAIPLYEQALQKLPPSSPNYAVLSRNLDVLYVNHSVGLIGQKQYAKAEALLKTAKSRNPNNSHANQTLATLYFRQAMDLRDAGQANPDKQDFEQIEKLIKQALAINPNDSNYKRGLAANYFDNGLAFAHEQNFEDAAPLLEMAHKLEPANSNIKESLVNVYLSMMHLETDPAKQSAVGDKVLLLDKSPETQATVQQILHPPTPESIAPTDSSTGGGAVQAAKKHLGLPASARKLSLQDMMLDIENQWGIERNPKAKLAERLSLAETQINGKESEGPLATRIQTLYTQIYGQPQQADTVVQGPLNMSEDVLKTTYIADVFKMTDGKVIRWAKFPVRVYIEEPTDKDNAKDFDGMYKTAYKQAVLDGIRRWQEASKGSVSLVEVKNTEAADIIFEFGKTYTDRFADPDKVPDWYKGYSTPKVNNKLMTAVQLASMFTPGLFSLIPMAVGSGMQYQRYKKLDVIRQESTIKLGLEPIFKLPEKQGVMLLQNIAAKEFGHALGIKATSPEPNDLMYPDFVSDRAKFPTKRDLDTLMQLYTRPANVLLNVQSQMTGRY